MKLLYENGTIITMEENQMLVEAICIEDNKIIATGSKQELEQLYSDAEIRDLHGKTMMPAFIDAHSHFTGLANSLRLCDLSKVKSYDELVETMKKFAKDHNVTETEWIIGANYDHNYMEEKEHPTRLVLDKISNTNPIYISHASSHMGVVNTKALEVMHVNSDVQDPKGGRYGRFEDGTLSGYMEECVFVDFINQVPMPSIEEMIKLYKEAQKLYASYGIATVQEGFVNNGLFQLLKAASSSQAFYLDVVGYVDAREKEDLCDANPEYDHYQNHFRIGGYKTFLDGSPQGKTAWMQQPYEGSKDYCGYPSMSKEELDQVIHKAVQNERQLLIHCNGDAAAKQYVEEFAKIAKQNPNKNIKRPVMIHAQLVRKEELEKMQEIQMIPSFFVAHTWYWGDIHIHNFGMERASHISPVQTAKKLNIPYTFHNDSPVIPPDLMKTIWCAVNRKTKDGVTIGEDEVVDVVDALKAITIYAAYQYFEEDRKGSLKEGKNADFIILNENPLTVNKEDLANILVLETWKDGNCIYQR